MSSDAGARAGGRARDGVSAQARALGDPTRYAVFEHLRQARRPLTVAELAEVFALHPNAIRQHLSKLAASGLVVEDSRPSRGRAGRGRPARTFAPSPGAIERWEQAGPHEELAAMLLDMLVTGDEPLEVGRRAGRRLAAALTDDGADPVSALIGVARQLGFDPLPEPPGPTARAPQAVVLRHCPFAGGARRAPQIVCRLHHGLAEGVCSAVPGSGRPVVVADLVVRHPDAAHCRILLG